jgi:hypothetical protein
MRAIYAARGEAVAECPTQDVLLRRLHETTVAVEEEEEEEMFICVCVCARARAIGYVWMKALV